MEPQSLEISLELSPAVKDNLQKLVQEVIKQLESWDTGVITC
jgi:hypothetical protein